MANNSVRGATEVATQYTDLHLHRHIDSPLVRKFDESWRHLLSLLRPPLQQFTNQQTPTSSSRSTYSTAESAAAPAIAARSPKARRRTGGAHQPHDSEKERSGRSLKATPTTLSSSQQPAGTSNSPHSVRGSAASAGKRRQETAIAGGEATPVHKKSETLGQDPSIEYKLVLVQEPTTGAAFEDNLLGRIGLAPPLILELQVIKNGEAGNNLEQLPLLICQCSLLDQDGNVADMLDRSVASASTSSSSATTLMPPTNTAPQSGTRARRGRSSSGRRGASSSTSARPSSESTNTEATPSSEDTSTTVTPTEQDTPPQLARMLYGTIVAGPQPYNSPEGVEKPYFFFPEISIRKPGKFKISCRLMRLPLPGLPPSATGILAAVETQVFEVLNRSDYIAPYITDVSRHFARQGVPLLLPPGVSAD